MRVVLIGTPAARAGLRADLVEAGIEIAAETTSLDAAQLLGTDVDAFVVAVPATRRARPATRDDEPVFVEALTPREHEVLALLAEGLSNKAIAARLSISDQTVKFHVASVYAKLGASNRTDAVRRGLRRGMITV